MRCFRDTHETQLITSLSVEGIIIYKKNENGTIGKVEDVV